MTGALKMRTRRVHEEGTQSAQSAQSNFCEKEILRSPRVLRSFFCCWVVIAFVIGLGAAEADAQSRLQRIRARGHLVCGVESGVAGFATVDAQGHYSGLDIDICRAVAAAIFGSDQN